jgi:hypothetical protein
VAAMKLLSWLLRTLLPLTTGPKAIASSWQPSFSPNFFRSSPRASWTDCRGRSLPGRETLYSGVGIERSSLNVTVCVPLLGERNQS